MADLYKVVYRAASAPEWKTAFVSATTLANAIAAVKSNDTAHKIDSSHVTVAIMHHNIISGS